MQPFVNQFTINHLSINYNFINVSAKIKKTSRIVQNYTGLNMY